MRKRSTRNRRHRHQVKVLASEVLSPRIALLSIFSALKSLAKIAAVIAILLAVAYGIRQAIEHTFHQNPDFQLQAIHLNPNDVLDEAALAEYLRIDLSGNIFDFDTGLLAEKLMEIPAISAARVERHLPGTLDIKLITRQPVAWVASPEENIPRTRQAGSLLVDREGFAYPCPPAGAVPASDLPMFVLTPDPSHPVKAGGILTHPQFRHCTHLLDSVRAEHPDGISKIDTIVPANEWSLLLTTRDGTSATFGLGDHRRQLDYLNRALLHSRQQGYHIDTINLIPKRNIPITVSGDDHAPRAIPVLEAATPETRQSLDLRKLLNRN